MKKEITFETIGSILGIISAVILLGGYIFDFFNEPNLIFLKPEKIYFRNYKFDPNGVGYLRLSTLMSYINEDNFGKSSIITKESISYDYYDKTVYQTWNTFDIFQENEEQQLTTISSGEIGPFIVNSRSAVNHNTYFAPVAIDCKGLADCQPDSNFVKFDDFLEYLENSIRQQHDYITLNIQCIVNVYKGDQITCTFNVRISSSQLQRLKKYGWVSLACF